MKYNVLAILAAILDFCFFSMKISIEHIYYQMVILRQYHPLLGTGTIHFERK